MRLSKDAIEVLSVMQCAPMAFDKGELAKDAFGATSRVNILRVGVALKEIRKAVGLFLLHSASIQLPGDHNYTQYAKRGKATQYAIPEKFWADAQDIVRRRWQA